MNAPRSHLFKLSVVALAISQVQLSYAEDATLPVIKLQAESNAEQSSEQTKAYIIKKAAVPPNSTSMRRKHPKRSM